MPLPLDFARTLRAEATPQERMLWRTLSRLRPRFTRQYRIGPYVGDFACRRAQVIVELDGGQHAESASDRVRDVEIESDRWVVLRFWNNEVTTNAAGVVEAIISAAEPRLPPGETFESVNPRPARKRKKKEPPPTPPASAGGE